MLTWVLLPESFALKVGIYRLSTGGFLSPEGLTINPGIFHEVVVRAGLHSYDQSYIEAAVTWRGNATAGGGNVNVSLISTVDTADSSQLTLTASVNNPDEVNASDFLLVLIPNFTHGRAGVASADSKGVKGVSAGLRETTVSLIQGTAVPIPAAAPPPASELEGRAPAPPAPHPGSVALGVSLGDTIVLSTDPTTTASAVATKTTSYRAKEAATLEGWGDWGEVKDAMQSSLTWSFMYDPKEGLVAPVTRNWGFGASNQLDGDQTEGLFCWCDLTWGHFDQAF